MRHMRKFVWLLVIALSMNLCLAVNATGESAGIWMNTEETETGITISICSDTVVADGLIMLSFDSSAMSFVELTADKQYVAAYSVNANEPGIVKISWVAPGEYQPEEATHVLMTLQFSGKLAEDLTISGVIHTPAGETVAVAELDFAPLEAAIAAAQALNKEEYTEESYAAVESALAEAIATMADELVTQKDLESALEKLNGAMDSLEKKPTENPDDDPGEDPGENPGENPGQDPSEDPGEDTDDDSNAGLWIGIGIAVVVVAAGVVVVVLMKKKGAA